MLILGSNSRVASQVQCSTTLDLEALCVEYLSIGLYLTTGYDLSHQSKLRREDRLQAIILILRRADVER
jgi:hypothetical protein